MRWILIPMMLLSCGVVSAQGVLERLRDRLQNAPLLDPVAPPPAVRPELGPPRPLLGFQAEERTEDGVRSVHVDRVQPETAAAQAGLEPGDQIVQLGEQPISSIEDLTAFMAQRRVGEEVEIKVLRDGQPVVATATLQADPRVLARPTLPQGGPLPGPRPDRDSADVPQPAIPLAQHGRLGVVVENVRPSEDAAASHVRISTVVPGSAAAAAGLLPGDQIRQIDGVAVDGAIDVARRMRATQPGQQVTIEFQRDGEVSQTTATLTAMAPVLGDPTPADSMPVGPPSIAAPADLPQPQDPGDAASTDPAEAGETATGETAELRRLLRELREEVGRLRDRVEQLESSQDDS
ncbi:PDZ domain-containing protein [Roseimaritima sediminicola]|uniref:PDZ domain-containing protein n=1 Tax=Roseimaritima sediminicola TaxID=2662066 RepID=UPI00129854D1|nr:PDZ domain-containing protein [Roseimaritima sediminicola]